MPDALNVLWWSVRAWVRNLIPLTVFNVIWAVLGATGILLPFAMAGLFVVANRIVYEQPARLNDFIAGGRRYWWPGTQWVITNGLAGLVMGVIVFQQPVEVDLNEWVALILVVITLIWLSMQFYFWPLMLETAHKQYSAVLFSTLMLHLAAPIYTLTLLVVTGTMVWIAFQIAWPLGLGMMSYVAIVANRATVEKLATYGWEPDAQRVDLQG